MGERRLIIAGANSGSGKTTLTIGLLAALKKKGYEVQGFKCGPDYIDPTFHTMVSGRRSRNLDSWMLSHDTLKSVLNQGSKGADISLIEGVMGFFDGRSPLSNEGSTAEIASIINTPVVLVLNCEAMARSAAAIVKGFHTFAEGNRIGAVIANKVGSEGHYKIVKAAIEQECGIPVVGYLENETGIEMPERHLGLVPAVVRGELDTFFEQIGELVSSTVDVDQLFELASTEAVECDTPSIFQRKREFDLRIAIAKDSAFHFYYPENLELLEAYGAECVYFSPLKDEPLPDDIDGLYIGGGFPEEYATELAVNHSFKQSLKEAIDNGLPVLAECGGFMVLTESIETTDGCQHPMVGVIPGHVKMQPKLAAIGYREIEGKEDNPLLSDGETARGHEFHYATFEVEEDLPVAYNMKGRDGKAFGEGVLKNNLIAGFTHLHFASNPKVVERWLETCRLKKQTIL
ncbi:cobyrinate a,c-diamide synthase [Pseudalkalibacillus decolorationis]|uniref:cobyrinate a,c-diamide synthase n=1 Tax=Pseudalkalibacillus decolorationis TaxID=163879 RepID=UPI00214777F4|nr:cobyrinate a,c-diamide synthase [Pseudalkalibacillus decolorationis]